MIMSQAERYWQCGPIIPIRFSGIILQARVLPERQVEYRTVPFSLCSVIETYLCALLFVLVFICVRHNAPRKWYWQCCHNRPTSSHGIILWAIVLPGRQVEFRTVPFSLCSVIERSVANNNMKIQNDCLTSSYVEKRLNDLTQVIVVPVSTQNCRRQIDSTVTPVLRAAFLTICQK